MTVPLDVHVKVFVTPGGANGNFYFETTDLPMGPNNHLYFRNCCDPGFNVYYDIQGGPYVFPNDKREALYSQGQPGCPSTAGQWGQFQATDIQNGGQTLVVSNKNETKQDFGYTLRVTNDGGATYLPLDPGGTNDNGSTARASFVTLSIAIVGGAVAGALVTLGVQSLIGG